MLPLDRKPVCDVQWCISRENGAEKSRKKRNSKFPRSEAQNPRAARSLTPRKKDTLNSEEIETLGSRESGLKTPGKWGYHSPRKEALCVSKILENWGLQIQWKGERETPNPGTVQTFGGSQTTGNWVLNYREVSLKLPESDSQTRQRQSRTKGDLFSLGQKEICFPGKWPWFITSAISAVVCLY